MKSPFFVSAVLVVDPRWKHQDYSNRLSKLTEVLGQAFDHFEVILVDSNPAKIGNSIDAVLNKLPGLRYLSLAGVRNSETAEYAGLDQVIGDYVILMDLFQDPAHLLPKTVELCSQSNALVYGSYSRNEKESVLMKPLSICFHAYCRWVLGFSLPKFASQFRVYNRFMVNSILKFRGRFPLFRLYGAAVGIPAVPFYFETALLSEISLKERLREGFEIILASPRQTVRFLGQLSAVFVSLMSLTIAALAFFSQTELIYTLAGFSILFLIAITWGFAETLMRAIDETSMKPLYYVAFEKKSNVLVPGLRTNIEH